ncbi:MAG: hypothetical protein JRJ29_01570 [Deltaproteobacteria bacterium]|nr:hypothetical protein [Deltaproteobacteria bacterium]
MKIQGFKVIYDEGHHLEVWEKVHVDLPLELAIQKKIVSVDSSHTPLRQNYEGELPFFCNVGTIKVKLNNKMKHIKQGLLVSSRLSALVDFLMKSYHPTGKSELDSYLKRCQRQKVSKESKKLKIEELLNPKNSAIDRKYSTSRDPLWGTSVHYIADDDLDALIRIELPSGCFRFPKAEEHLVVSIYYKVDFRGHKILRRKFAVIDEPDKDVIYWDGERIRSYKNVKELPESFLNSINSSEKVIVEDEVPGREMFFSELKPLFVLRVPATKDLTGKEKDRAKLDARLKSPCIFLPSDYPILLPSGNGRKGKAAVIDDPQDALYVLRRTDQNMIYVPTASPIDLVESKLPKEEQHWIGAFPGE